MGPLEIAALASACWAIAGLSISATRAWHRKTSAVRAVPAGNRWRGVLYAFGPGMSPRAKESAFEHPAVYAAGVTYHAGVLSAVATFFIVIFRFSVPAAFAGALAALLVAAGIAGVALLARRLSTALLREISALDDYGANVIVDAWLFAAALACLQPETAPPFLSISFVLGLYAPFGKIRHCAFFALSRGVYGARLGHRGIVQWPRASR